MDARLEKQWKIAETLLTEAAIELPYEALADFRDLISHNEVGLALEVLHDEGSKGSRSSKFWHLLKQTADLLGMNEIRADLRCHYLEAVALESK
jgi:hypothetical protein